MQGGNARSAAILQYDNIEAFSLNFHNYRSRELRRRRILRAEQGRVQCGPARAHEVVPELFHPETVPRTGRQVD